MNIKYFCGNSHYESVHYELILCCHNYIKIFFSMLCLNVLKYIIYLKVLIPSKYFQS